MSVQNEVGPTEYGFYASLFSFSVLINIILDVGITNYNNRNIAQHRHMLSKYFSKIFVIRLMLGLIYFAVAITVGMFMGYSWEQFQLLFVLLFNQFLAMFLLYLRSNVSGLHLFKTDSLLSVLDRFLMIIIVGALLWGGITNIPFKIEWFVYAQTISYLAASMIAFAIVVRKTDYFRPVFKTKYLLIILKQSFPFALLILLMTGFYRMDSVMLERILPDGKYQAGIYAQGFRVLEAVNMFAFLFAGLLLPIFSRLIKKNEPTESLTQFSFSLIIVPAVVLAIGCFYYNEEIIGLLYKHQTIISTRVFQILMLNFVMMATSYIFGTLLTANGNLKELNILAGSMVVLNLVLNFVLIPIYYAYGAALASLITQFIYAVAQILLVQKYFRYHVNIKLIITLFVFVGSLLLMGNYSKLAFDNWVFNFLIMVGAGIILSFLLRMINLKTVLEILKEDSGEG
jgi:O-antigen/teichoic acid export membrane protein